MSYKVTLIETSADNYEEYYHVRCSPADIYWNGHTSPPEYETFRKLFLSRLSSARFTQPEDRRLYLIRLEEENLFQVVGFVQLIKHEEYVEIGYSVIEAYQKRGIASVALKSAISLARMHDKRICVRIRDDNIASQKVAMKNGFVRTDVYEICEYSNAGKVKLRTYRLMPLQED